MEIIANTEPTTRPDGTPLEIGDVWKQGSNTYYFDSLVINNDFANTDIIHFDWQDELAAAASDPNANLDLIEIPQGSNTFIEDTSANTEPTIVEPQWISTDSETTILYGGIEYTVQPPPSEN